MLSRVQKPGSAAAWPYDGLAACRFGGTWRAAAALLLLVRLNAARIMLITRNSVMLTRVLAAFAIVVLTGSAFAQTFDRPFDHSRRNVQPQNRPAPFKSYSTTATTPSIDPYAGQIGAPPPPSAYTGTYSSTYGAAVGNR